MEIVFSGEIIIFSELTVLNLVNSFVAKWFFNLILFCFYNEWKFYFYILVLSEPPTPAHPLDYNFAREEFMLNELSNDPIQTAIAKMEKQHEEDKQGMYIEMGLFQKLIWISF